MKTLEEILEREKQVRREDGEFGMVACKESIRWSVENLGKSLYELLEIYVYRANHECLFNDRMVLACWELINSKEEEL